MELNDILEKYSSSVIKNMDYDNTIKIIEYLLKENCNKIDAMLEDYLDIFTIEYNEFIKKIDKLNIKYNNRYLSLIEEDLNYLEELFND